MRIALLPPLHYQVHFMYLLCHRPHVDRTVECTILCTIFVHRPYIDFTRTLLRPYIDQTMHERQVSSYCVVHSIMSVKMLTSYKTYPQTTQTFTHHLTSLLQVLVVQACQMYRTSGLSLPAEPQAGPSTAIDANRANPPEQTRIDLKRPHSVMMLATVPGGAAVRGAFTGALADEISQADGKTDIHAIFTKASDAISSNSFAQQPVFRSTLRKKLVLPKVDRSGAQK